MKSILLALVAILATDIARASSELVQRITKEQFASMEHLPPGVTVSFSGDPENPVIQVASDGRAPASVELLTIKHPTVTTAFFGLRGQVRYADVRSDGFLEMWTWFGEADSYFTRSLAEGGPLGKLTSHSDWRGFCLPFNATLARETPTRLVMKMNLPGRGTVTLRNVELQQARSFADLVDQQSAWWSERTIGIIGGVAGTLFGCLGSLLELLSRRGKARRFVFATAWVLTAVGGTSIVTGLIALGTEQPHGITFMFFLVGILCVAVFPARLHRYSRRYHQIELRRMASLDAVGA